MHLCSTELVARPPSKHMTGSIASGKETLRTQYCDMHDRAGFCRIYILASSSIPMWSRLLQANMSPIIYSPGEPRRTQRCTQDPLPQAALTVEKCAVSSSSMYRHRSFRGQRSSGVRYVSFIYPLVCTQGGVCEAAHFCSRTMPRLCFRMRCWDLSKGHIQQQPEIMLYILCRATKDVSLWIPFHGSRCR